MTQQTSSTKQPTAPKTPFWRSTRAVFALGAVASLPLVAVSLTVGTGVTEAARVTASAVAEILRSTSGISSSSNFEVGLPPITDSQVVVQVEANRETASRLAESVDAARLISKPATFGVSGEPNQVFSVSLPTQKVANVSSFGATQEAVVVFSEFSHDAGITPTIGANGNAVFAVGARVAVLPTSGPDSGASSLPDGLDGGQLGATPGEGAEDLLQSGDELGSETGDAANSPDSDAAGEITLGLDDTDNLLTASGTSDSDIAAALRRHNPFNFALDPRFLNVLVSYN